MSKRLLSAFLCIVMLVGMIPFGAVNAAVTSLQGNGTEESPYEIGSAHELVFMAERLNASDAAYVGKYFKLMADIDLSSVESFPMIVSFSGVLYGNGKTISNLKISDNSGAVVTTDYGIAFIHKLSGRICDLTFDNAVITSNVDASANGNSGAAVVVAETVQDAIVSSVTVKNCLVETPLVPKAGGIAALHARAANKGTVIGIIRNCVVEDTTLIAGPRAAGNKYGLMMGGIAGYSATSTIENCFVKNVTMQAANENTCPFYAAMIVGYAAGGEISGNVSVSGKIERTNETQLFTTVKVGGMVSAKNTTSGGAITSTYPNLMDITNNPEIPAGAAIAGTDTSEAALKAMATYLDLGWDFDDIWKMVGEYPSLKDPNEKGPLKLEGTGTDEDPYQIADKDDLLYAVQNLNNKDERIVGKALKLTADIDLGGVSFTPIEKFDGTIDGDGHTISNLTIEDTSTADKGAEYRVAFIRTNNGTVKNITFASPRISTLAFSAGGNSGAAVIVGDNANGSMISGCVVLDAVVYAPNLPKAGGIAVLNARTTNINATISRCVFEGTLTLGPRAGNYGPMVGGVAAYSATSTIEYCVVNADIIYKGNESIQSSNIYAGIICGYSNRVTYRSNVAYGGSITIDGEVADQRLAGIYAPISFTQTPISNISCEDITLNGTNITVSDNNGTLVTSDMVTKQETYENIGYNFYLFWEMTEKYPLPKNSDPGDPLELEGQGTKEDPYLIGDKYDLLYAVTFLNAHDERIAGKELKLTADIDLNGTSFTPIEKLDGIIDGDGHTIYNLTINDTVTANMGDSYCVAFIRTNNGTVKNLNFASPRISTTALSTGGFSGAAVIVGENTNGSLVSGCVVTDAVVYAPHLPKAAGIAVLNARTSGINATISRCVFEGTLTCGPREGTYGPMLGGIAAYSATSTIEYCIVDCDIIYKGNDTMVSPNIYAAMICGFANSVTFRSNVAYGGSVTLEGEIADQRLATIYAPISYGQSLSKNISCDNITLAGVAVEKSDNNGKIVTADELILQETYEKNGYNFDLLWTMNDGEGYPDRYPVPVILEYSDNEINRLTANLKGAAEIGFTFHYLEGKDMVIKVSETEDFANALTFTAVGDGDIYKADAKGLKTATTYYYRAEGDGKVSATGRFTTDDGELSFISISDTEGQDFYGASQAAMNIAGALYASSDADFILHSGDMVDDARGEEGWQDLIYQAQDSLLSKPMVVTLGEKDKDGVLDHFNLDNTYYSFDYANAHIIVLDTNTLGDEQINWLKADVAATDKDWVILSMHKGPYTSGQFANTVEANELRSLFINELDDLGIDLVIQGHDHIMGHTYDLHNGEVSAQPVYTETINGKRFNYTVDPEGIVYMMSGVMGTEYGKQMTCDDLDAYIMQFERSDGRGNVPTYAKVTVRDDRIEVATYEIKADMQPTMIEGFGIDRAVGKVESIIASGDYTTARKEFNKLTTAQKNQISNYSDLIANEGGNALKEDGAAWLDEKATERRSIVVTNDSTVDFDYAPVLVKLENAPSKKMAFYTTEGEALPYEVESYNKNGISYVWVNVSHIPADSAATLWVYFGGRSTEDPDAVWNDSYGLVEHFDDISDATMHGNVTTNTENGDAVGIFDGESALTYGSVGDDFNHLSVSAIVQMEADGDIHRSGIVSKYNRNNPDGNSSYTLRVDTDGNLLSFYGATWWRTNEVVIEKYNTTEMIADGQPHLITLSYDGFTIETFLDGKCIAWETVLIENATFLVPEMLTTIGAYSDLERPFTGKIYDVQINGARLSGQWEEFRYNNYFGDAVKVGEPEHKDDFSFTVASVDGSIVGIVSKDATLKTEINGVDVKLADTKAGRFEVEVPHPGTGEFEITVTATNDTNTLSDKVIIPALDEDAPAQPEIGMDEDDSLYVNTVPDKNDLVDVTVNVSEYIPLSSANAAVAVGSTEANTPVGVDPTLLGYGEFTDSLTTTVEDGTNPYQVFKVALTEEEVSYGAWRFAWQGTSDRQLHAYAYNASLGEWTKITSSVGTGDITMNIEIEGTEYLYGNSLYLMIFRGLGQELAEMTSFIPEENQYDFTMFWNSDTQYLGQFAENMLYHQHEWIADNFDDKKGVITFNTGDVSNRTNLNYEYNWEVVDNSYNIFEEAGIPYTFNWGNHDLNYDSQPNETRYNRLYFPTSRLDENKGGWEVSYAPDAADGTTTRAMAYKQTIDGAKIMILSLAYNSYLTESDLTWAEQTLAANPDYTVIIITHNYASNSAIKDTNIRTRLADVYPNVKLVLCGHLDGTAVHKDANGSFVVLQDYQGESGKVKHGGNEFLKLIQFDVENDLIYFNTYSPLTGETLSPIGEKPDAEAEGLYQKNGDEFALNIELNGDKTRSFTTAALTLSSGKVEFTHTVRITEGDSVKIAPKGLTAGREYLYYAVLTDSSGNVTVTPVHLFTEITDRVDYELEAAKAELSAILSALPAYKESDYTEDSWDMFISAKLAAEHILETAESKDIVLEAIKNLNNATEALTLKPQISFTDVKESHWYYNAVMYAAQRGIFKGNPDGSFAPNKAITRAEFVMVLANYSGEDYSTEECSKFTDVKSSAWYYHAMAWAANRGIVNGMTEDTFAPTKTITRQDLCLMLTNYLKYKEIEVESSVSETFADDAKIGKWAYDAVYTIKSIGVVSGMGANEFQPRGNATRAQVAQMMMMFDQYLSK
ncbi:MAG: DUF2341 domain-containing protein [Clostridia bacterium]|nr:DUF2341 domain-containing protein [Clostridia bacterium]